MWLQALVVLAVSTTPAQEYLEPWNPFLGACDSKKTYECESGMMEGYCELILALYRSSEFDQGGSGLHFSSTRVIPVTSVKHLTYGK